MQPSPQPAPKPKNRAGRTCLILALLALVALVLAAIGLLAYLFTRPKTVPLLVSITDPQNGELGQVGAALQVSASAIQATGVQRLELFADGALVDARDTTLAQGSNPLVLVTNWTPLTPGTHLLMARASGRNGAHADSTLVFVDITPAVAQDLDVDGIPGEPRPSLNDLAGAAGTTPADLAAGSPHLAGHPPDAPLPPGTHISPPPGSSPPSPASPPSPPIPPVGAPGAPAWDTLDPNVCGSIRLLWHDSPDEERYVLYRRAPGEGALTARRSFPANTTSFTDTITATGSYIYQVAAVRGTFESRTATFRVDTPARCDTAPRPPATRDLVLNLTRIQTGNDYAGIFCYLTLNRAPVERIPADIRAVLLPTSGGRTYAGTSLPNRGRMPIGAQPEANPVVINGECIGRSGLLVYSMGEFRTTHAAADWDGRPLTLTSTSPAGRTMTLSYCITNAGTPCRGATGIFLGGFLFDLDTLFGIPKPHNLRVANSVEACSLLTGGWTEKMNCILSGGISTLYWDWEPNLAYRETDLTGFRVRVEPISGTIRTLPMERFLPPNRRLSPSYIHLQPCGVTYRFTVTANTARGGSMPSDPFVLDTPPCPSEVRVAVTFTRLSIGTPVQDRGDFCLFCGGAPDDHVELSGSIYAAGSALSSATSKFLWRGASDGLPVILPAGNHDMTRLYFQSMPGGGGARQNNTRFEFTLDNPAQTVSFGSSISEMDQPTPFSGWRPERMCQANMELPPLSLVDWDGFNQTFLLTDTSNPEAGCSIVVTVTGARVR